METKSLFDLLGSLIFILLKEYRSALIGQSTFSGKSGPVKGARAGIVTGDKAVSGLSGFWVFAMKTRKEPQGGALLIVSKYDISRKAQTSLLRLAAANVRRKAVLRVRTASEQTFIG